MLPIDLQARMMLATGNIDELLVGNAYATEEELKKLYEVLKESSKIQNDLDPTLKMLIEHGIISLDKPVKRLRVILDQNITEKEKEVLFDFSHIWRWETVQNGFGAQEFLVLNIASQKKLSHQEK